MLTDTYFGYLGSCTVEVIWVRDMHVVLTESNLTRLDKHAPSPSEELVTVTVILYTSYYTLLTIHSIYTPPISQGNYERDEIEAFHPTRNGHGDSVQFTLVTTRAAS